MEIREIKQQLGILRVLQHYGLKPNRHEMLCCPFHEDKEPSMKIYPKTNTFNCFGCSANGDVIEFIQLKEKAITAKFGKCSIKQQDTNLLS